MDKRKRAGVREPFLFMRGIFIQESRCVRVHMGYLLGIAILGWYLTGFLRYALAMGEPVNIWEAFVVIEQEQSGLLFLALGYFLVIADAPFVKSNTYFMLYRSSRKNWNMGMLFYVLLQAFLYVSCLAAVTVVVSSFIGFHGDIWSSPVYRLAQDSGNVLAVRYGVSFYWKDMMRQMTVPQAFGLTFLSMYCYIAFLGMLLYVCNLALGGFWGMFFSAGVHLMGYVFRLDGEAFGLTAGLSLLRQAVPGYFVDGTNAYWKPPCMFLTLIFLMACLSLWLVRKTDMQKRAEGDG